MILGEWFGKMVDVGRNLWCFDGGFSLSVDIGAGFAGSDVRKDE